MGQLKRNISQRTKQEQESRRLSLNLHVVSTRPDPVDQSGSFSTVFIVVRACSARAWRHSVLSLWNRRAEGGCVISLLQLPAKVCQKFPWNVKLNKNGMCFEHLEEDKYLTPSGSMLWTKFVKKKARFCVTTCSTKRQPRFFSDNVLVAFITLNTCSTCIKILSQLSQLM